MVRWPKNVNTKVRRSTEGDMSIGVIADETRCGVRKTRVATQLTPNTFSVVMMFSPEEWTLFLSWFTYNLRRGALSFGFPKIDDQSGIITEYRFSADSKVHWSNPDGDRIQITMDWEEV